MVQLIQSEHDERITVTACLARRGSITFSGHSHLDFKYCQGAPSTRTFVQKSRIIWRPSTRGPYFMALNAFFNIFSSRGDTVLLLQFSNIECVSPVQFSRTPNLGGAHSCFDSVASFVSVTIANKVW
jgi:hypothetical protein